MDNPPEKEKRIIWAATTLFAKYGIRKTTIDEIARDAGMAKGTIYLYFRNKQEIVSAVVRRLGVDLIATLQRAVASQDNAPEKLEAFVLERFRFTEAQKRLMNISEEVHQEVDDYLKRSLTGRNVLEEYFRQERAIIETILQMGVTQGQLEIDNIPMVAFVISATLEGLDRPWNTTAPDVSLEEKAGLMIRLILEGMRKKQTGSPSPVHPG